uniref:Uncharacterized protein n=1 Tax=Toxoplasma gondii (strain ATCC 50861 / VEG) TaxID=432359 RepID=A0A0F7UY80_TOXGV|nr:TPA: hypothetical protein BN1205_036180 [Toxoplasma gondii VEG]
MRQRETLLREEQRSESEKIEEGIAYERLRVLCEKLALLSTSFPRTSGRTASLQQPREEDLSQPQASTFLAFEESAGGRRQGKAFLEKERPGRPRESNSVSQGDGAVEDAAKEGRRIEIVNCAFSLHALEAWVPQPSPCCAAAAAVGAWNAVQQLVFSRERSVHGERRQTNRKIEEAGPGGWAESERQARKEEKNGGRKEEVHQTGKEGATGERSGDEDAEKTEAVEVESGERDGNREDKSGEGNGRQVTQQEKENFSRENTGNDQAGTTEEKRDNEEAAESSIEALPSVSSRSAESVETGLKSLLSDASGARRAMRFRLLSLISSASEMKDRRKREQAREELIQLEEEVLGKLFAAEMEAKNEEGRTRQDQQQKTQSEEKEVERRTEEDRVNPKRQKEGEEEEGKTREKKRESGCRRGSTSEDTQVKPTGEEKSNTGETDGHEEGKKHWQEKEESEEDNDEGSDEERKNPKGSETGRQQTLECLTVDATDRDTKRKRNKALLVRLLRGSLASYFPSSIDDKDSDNLSQQLWCRDEKVQTDTRTGADAIFERETPTNESVEIKREWKTSAEILACSTACSRLLGAVRTRLDLPEEKKSEERGDTAGREEETGEREEDDREDRRDGTNTESVGRTKRKEEAERRSRGDKGERRNEEEGEQEGEDTRERERQNGEHREGEEEGRDSCVREKRVAEKKEMESTRNVESEGSDKKHEEEKRSIFHRQELPKRSSQSQSAVSSPHKSVSSGLPWNESWSVRRRLAFSLWHLSASETSQRETKNAEELVAFSAPRQAMLTREAERERELQAPPNTRGGLEGTPPFSSASSRPLASSAPSVSWTPPDAGSSLSRVVPCSPSSSGSPPLSILCMQLPNSSRIHLPLSRLSPQGGASEEPAGTQKAAGVSTSEAASWVLERAATKEVSRRKESARRKSVCPSEAETPQDQEGVKEDAPGREEGQGEEVGEGAAERQEEKKGAGEDARTCPEERRLGRVSQEEQGQANEACGVESDGEREAEREEERKAREERDPRTEQGPTHVSGGRVACRRRASSRKRRKNKSRHGLAFHRKVMSGLEMLLQRGQAEKRLTFARPSTRHVGNKQLLEAFVAIEKKRHWCRGVARAAERRERSSDEEEPEEQAARQEREGQRRERRGDREVEEAAEREGEEAPHGEKAEGETAAFEGREREKEGKEGDGETERNEETESVEKVLDRDRLISREDGALSLGGGHDEGVEAKREEKERDEHEWLASTWVCPLCDHGVRAFALMGGPGTRSKWIVERPKRNHERQNREVREKRTELEWIEEQEKRVREEQETQVAKGNWKVLERGLAKEEKEEGVRHNNARRLEMQTEREDSDQEESTTETGDGRAQRRKDEDGRAGTETETEREKTEKVDEEIDEAASEKDWKRFREAFEEKDSALVLHLQNHYALVFGLREVCEVESERKAGTEETVLGRLPARRSRSRSQEKSHDQNLTADQSQLPGANPEATTSTRFSGGTLKMQNLHDPPYVRNGVYFSSYAFAVSAADARTEHPSRDSDRSVCSLEKHASSRLEAGADGRRRDRVFAVTLEQPEIRGMRQFSLESRRRLSPEGGEDGFLRVAKETRNEVDRRRRLRKRDVLTARRGQAPSAWISFEELRGLMLRWKGYRVLQMQRCSFSQDATTREGNLAQRACRKSKATATNFTI